MKTHPQFAPPIIIEPCPVTLEVWFRRRHAADEPYDAFATLIFIMILGAAVLLATLIAGNISALGLYVLHELQ